MKTFKKYLEQKIYLEAEAPPSDAGGMAPPDLGGDMGGLPMGGADLGAPPDLGGGMGASPMGGPDLGAPSMGGPSLSSGPEGVTGAAGATQAAKKLKAYNVWDVLERLLKKSK